MPYSNRSSNPSTVAPSADEGSVNAIGHAESRGPVIAWSRGGG